MLYKLNFFNKQLMIIGIIMDNAKFKNKFIQKNLNLNINKIFLFAVVKKQ